MPIRRTAPIRFESVLWQRGFRYVAGVDEAGRGSLAGPVVAAAVIWPEEAPDPGICDSKLLTPERRTELLEHIQSDALSYAIGLCTVEEIDRLNILHAAMLAMERATKGLDPAADFCLVDGDRLPVMLTMPGRAIVKGDNRSRSVAAASILAKVTRDRIMEELHGDYPDYCWNANKGYATEAHARALARLGPSPLHRRSFRLRGWGVSK